MTETTLQRAILSVPDISCAHCARTITEALEPVAGIERVAVDPPGHTVEVVYDPDQVDIGRMSAILAAEDYPVAAVETATPAGRRA